MMIKEQAAQMDYSISEVAIIIEMSRESVRRYIKAGMLKAVKRGKSYRVNADDLYTFLKSQHRRQEAVN
jgi:excisionase family DNA binding protein